MTIREVLEGLEYRLKGLTDAYECLSKESNLTSVLNDFEIRIDEVESMYRWVRKNSGE
jgi:archaellum component FlaC